MSLAIKSKSPKHSILKLKTRIHMVKVRVATTKNQTQSLMHAGQHSVMELQPLAESLKYILMDGK